MKHLKNLFLMLFAFASSLTYAQDKAVAVQTTKTSGKSEKAFSIIEKSPMLTKATFRRDLKASGNVIEIEALNVSGGSVSLSQAASSNGSAVLPPANITDITSITGNYLSTRDISKSGRGVVMQLLDVNYPYRARINVSNQVLEFEIKEPGFWKINVAVSQ